MKGSAMSQKSGTALLDVSLEKSHIGSFDAESDHWENHGWCLRFSGGGREYLLWVAFYIIRSGAETRFVVDDIRVNQAMVVAVEEDRLNLSDNDFHVSGVHWSEYEPPEALTVGEDSSGVRWQMEGRTHLSGPDGWAILGRAGELELELHLDPVASPFEFEEFELIKGSEAIARVSGSVTRSGETAHVQGFGQHEKVHTGLPIQRKDRVGFADVADELQHMWHCGLGRRLGISMLANQPGENAERLNGHILVHGHAVRFGRGDVEWSASEFWVDPRSGVRVPTAWALSVTTPEGTLSLTARARGRSYYLWDYLRGSISLLYWFLCDADMVWRPREGDPIHEDAVPYAAHTNRPFAYWGSVLGSQNTESTPSRSAS